jgi:hypothetical protein
VACRNRSRGLQESEYSGSAPGVEKKDPEAVDEEGG